MTVSSVCLKTNPPLDMPILLAALGILAAFWLFQPSFLAAFSMSDLLSQPHVSIHSDGLGHVDAPERRLATITDIDSAAVIAYDRESGYGLLSEAASEQRPIASLTKLMTALVFLETDPDWNSSYTVHRSDRREGGVITLFPGDKVSTRDLFRTALIASDNSAIAGLVRSSGMSEAAFVGRMNERAAEMHLRSTVFAEPTGLSPANRSTARDVTRLLEAALEQSDIREALTRENYAFTTTDGREKNVETTNKLLSSNLPLNIRQIGGKTGHIPEAGFCFAGWFEKDGREVITVVLGAPTEAARFAETEKLVKWVYTTYEWNN